jgi:hypothetical protein
LSTTGTLLFFAALAALYLGGVWGLQRSLLYPAPPAPRVAPTLPPGGEAVWLGEDPKTEAWLLRPSSPPPYTAVLFTHGNGELIDHWLASFRSLTNAGYAVLLLEYPGYGRSGGSPSQESITAAIVAGYDFLAKSPDVDDAKIVAYGRSLGGGAACALALQRNVAALILESTFTSVRALAPRLGAPGALVRDPYENLDAMKNLDVPTLVLHGARDTLIPVSHGEALAEAAGVDLIRLPCGHNDCPRPWREIREFLTAQGLE